MPLAQAIDLGRASEWWQRQAAALEITNRIAIEEIKLLKKRRVADAARIAELEGPPSRYYSCGCPAQMSKKIQAFCPVHCKMLADPTTEK